ncbi:MAG: Na+/H+ antiporter subunit E [Lachnospiraceae bacterium]|nr:Na+/H+ antiporter subunit E [Lachnospiraceae bacterium]
MYIILVLLWIIFNGRFSPEILISGLIMAGLIYFFMCRFLNFSLSKDLLKFKRFFLIIWYILNLVAEIIKANISAFRLIMSNRYELEPVLVHFTTDIKTNALRVLLANSITLTPGTITVSLEGNDLLVHCLDRELAKGLDESSFVHILRRMEEVMNDK